MTDIDGITSTPVTLHVHHLEEEQLVVEAKEAELHVSAKLGRKKRLCLRIIPTEPTPEPQMGPVPTFVERQRQLVEELENAPPLPRKKQKIT